MPRWPRRIRLTLAAIAFSAVQVHAQAVLNPEQMRELASQAVLQGQAGLAFDLTGALIDRDDTDLDAHLIRSRAARNLGRNDEALTHARRAWALAEGEQARYAAALAMAQALSSSGRRTAAQLWLRRAVQIAPNDALEARAAADFRYVRRQNPWSTALRFSVSPSSNINNDSRNETSELFGLPFEFALEGEARALSGVEVSAGFSTRYRLVNTDRKRTDLLFGLSHRTYVLSDEAKDIAPDADGSDFATSSVFVGLQENYALPGGKARLGWDARIGRTWYGGDPLLTYNRIGATYRRTAGDRGMFNLAISREGQDGETGRDDATIWSAHVGYGMALASGNTLSVSTTFTESESDADYLDYTLRAISARYGLAKPIGPAQLEFGLTLSEKRHERSNLTTDGRDERSIKATVTAALPDMDFYGFIPTITLNAERTDANIDLYETENFGIQLGIRSAF
ncbi:tetratricopeptide repeat protein [Marivita sp.]|uniref:tetratricopeptide repeat protein n=1 Tax=Marivita sp. TaxID=2003365 RepID=UPI003F6B1A3D